MGMGGVGGGETVERATLGAINEKVRIARTKC